MIGCVEPLIIILNRWILLIRPLQSIFISLMLRIASLKAHLLSNKVSSITISLPQTPRKMHSFNWPPWNHKLTQISLSPSKRATSMSKSTKRNSLMILRLTSRSPSTHHRLHLRIQIHRKKVKTSKSNVINRKIRKIAAIYSIGLVCPIDPISSTAIFLFYPVKIIITQKWGPVSRRQYIRSTVSRKNNSRKSKDRLFSMLIPNVQRRKMSN